MIERSTPIRVFIVDDSALVRQVLGQYLGNHPGIQVVGMAADPLYACLLYTSPSPRDS